MRGRSPESNSRFLPSKSMIKPMDSTTDKIKGLANEMVGNSKQGAGKASGNEKLQAEGRARS